MKWDLFIMSSYGKNPPLPIPKPILISFLEERGGGILTRPGAMRQGRWVWAVMGISHPWTLVDPLVQHRSHSEHLCGAAFDPPSITTLPSFGGKFLMQKRDGGNRFVPWKSIWSGWGEQCWWWLVGEAPGCFRGDDDKETASKTMVAKWNLIWIVLNWWLRCELCLDWIKLSWSIFQNAQFQAVPYEQHPLCISICRILRVYCKPRLGDCGELITSQIHWSGWIVCLSTTCPVPTQSIFLCNNAFVRFWSASNFLCLIWFPLSIDIFILVLGRRFFGNSELEPCREVAWVVSGEHLPA